MSSQSDDDGPMFEHAAEPMIIEPLAAGPRGSGSVVLEDDFGDMALDVERSPTLEMDVIVPDGGPPLPLLDLDERSQGAFEREHALDGLPILDSEERSPLRSVDDEAEEETVEPVWQAEPPPKERPIVPLGPRASSPTPVPPPLSRVDQLRLNVAHAPASWDLHRQLAEALLEEGDRAGGIAELETTMFGYEREGNLADASRSADELIRVEPDSVRYHQKRVEYAVRANDKPQLVDAYLCAGGEPVPERTARQVARGVRARGRARAVRRARRLGVARARSRGRAARTGCACAPARSGDRGTSRGA